jgi:hypothetical protein
VKALLERWPRARSSEDFAWACLLANLAGVPGMGTMMARRREGPAQLALSVAGGVLLTWWIVAFVMAVLRTMELPPPDGPPIALFLSGLGLFAVSWLWALFSGLAVVRGQRRGAAPPA